MGSRTHPHPPVRRCRLPQPRRIRALPRPRRRHGATAVGGRSAGAGDEGAARRHVSRVMITSLRLNPREEVSIICSMTEARRGAVRLISAEPAVLRFSRRSVDCILVDLSVTGARVRLTPPQLVADHVTLTT